MEDLGEIFLDDDGEIDSNIDLDVDFDISDFDLTDDVQQTRIMRPRVGKRQISQKVAYDNAEKFAEFLDLDVGQRTYAIISGNFSFGDLPEALLYGRHVEYDEIYICSLSISQDNIDSLRTCMEALPDMRLNLILSGYFFGMEKFKLVPYLYDELDLDERLQVCFSNVHCKIILLGCKDGRKLVIHGSANMRSCNSIEQIMCEEDAELYDFNKRIFDSLTEAYGTIDHSIKREIVGEKAWQAVRAASTESAKTSGKARRHVKDAR